MNYTKSTLTSIVLIAGFFVNVANAGVIFFDDFEDGILMDNPLYAANNKGIIVSDPLEGDSALSFSGVSTGSDLNSVTMTSSTGNVFLSFDYMGTCVGLTGGCGGYFLLPEAGNGWIGTSTTANNWGFTLTDDNTWNHYKVSYAATNFSFKLQDWKGVGDEIAGDAFFDNIRFSDTGFAVVPEPMPLAIFALGIFGLTIRRFAK
jgi:hypothetical protein